MIKTSFQSLYQMIIVMVKILAQYDAFKITLEKKNNRFSIKITQVECTISYDNIWGWRFVCSKPLATIILNSEKLSNYQSHECE